MKTLYVNGRVFTGTLPLQDSFAVENGRFADVQNTQQVVDLQGAFVCPGFIDSHMHVLNYGSAMEQCDLTAATGSMQQLQQALRQHMQGLPEGAWVLGRGWNQDYFVPAAGMPTRAELDEVTTEHPVCIVRCCGHCLSVNSRALEVLGIDENTPVPDGGSVDLDENGQLTGVMRDSAMTLVQGRLPVPQTQDLKRMMKTAMRALNRVGVTSCHSDDFCTFDSVPWQQVMQAYRELEEAGELTVRVYEQSQLTTPDELRDFLKQGYRTGVGSEWFKIGPLKMLGDGSLGARTAYLSGSYADAPDEKGLAIFTQEQFDEMLSIAHEGGMQSAVHAIGDGILDRVLSAYERAFAKAPPRDHRSGIVHVQLTRPDQWQKMKELNLHMYVQNIFIDYDTRIVHQRAGEELAASSYAFHTFKKLGMHVSNGTDCPVEKPDPMRGVQCAVTRQPLDGSLPPYRAKECMTVEEALVSYTAEGAYASFEEDFKGRIQPGMAADFVILSGNPFETAPERLCGIRALSTYVNGELVYQEKEENA